MQDADDFDNEKFYFDEDAEYESERDIEASMLDEDIQALHKKYVVDGVRIGYYLNSKSKFIDHARYCLEKMR